MTRAIKKAWRIEWWNKQLTWARISFIQSLASASPWPKTHRSFSNLIWRKGSVIPAMSYSGEYGLFTASLRVLTRPSVDLCIKFITWCQSITKVFRPFYTDALKKYGQHLTLYKNLLSTNLLLCIYLDSLETSIQNKTGVMLINNSEVSKLQAKWDMNI